MPFSNMVTVRCSNCDCEFGLTSSRVELLKRTHAVFYCTNGHSQLFTGKTKDQKRIDHLMQRISDQASQIGAQGGLLAVPFRCPIAYCDCRSKTKKAARDHLRKQHDWSEPKTLALPADAGPDAAGEMIN